MPLRRDGVSNWIKSELAKVWDDNLDRFCGETIVGNCNQLGKHLPVRSVRKFAREKVNTVSETGNSILKRISPGRNDLKS